MWQVSSLTFQFTSLLGSDFLDFTTQNILLAKHLNSEMSSLRKTESSSVNFFFFTSQNS